MDRFDRIYRLHNLLATRRIPIPLIGIIENLECSKSTANRAIETLRDYLGAPLEYSRESNGYFYNQATSEHPYQLPGLWFSAEELNGLLICHQILQNISPGILSEQITQLQQRIGELFRKQHLTQPEISQQIQLLSVGRRLQDDAHFKRVATGLFTGSRLKIDYRTRGNDSQQNRRTVSPQKLLYYRDNWYLVAWCHLRKAMRIFAIDNITSSHILEQNSKIITSDILDAFINDAYGIFSGKAKHTAVLEFSKTRAKWIADEQWHPKQKGEWLENGNYRLALPFNDSRELIMDILKHGAEAEVISPDFLRQAVKIQIREMMKKYSATSPNDIVTKDNQQHESE